MTVLFALWLAFGPPGDSPTPAPGPAPALVTWSPYRAPWTHTWAAESTTHPGGSLLVVAVDPALARPRSAWQPVLYLDERPIQVLARTPDAGCLVGLVSTPDPTGHRLYWGSTQLPERVTQAWGRAELAASDAKPLPRSPPRPARTDRADLAAKALLVHCP